MGDFSIVRLSDLNDEYKENAIELFVDGFKYMFSFTKNKNVLKELFLNPMDFSMIYVALYENNIVGFIGVSNNKKHPSISKNIEKINGILDKELG
ncbi:hypothetical protein [Tissierella praeacuta]|uniref:hypothetical protein n=1 Tax=Tissierella praeacuta TaxID=43131 RepID=UPI003340CCCB